MESVEPVFPGGLGENDIPVQPSRRDVGSGRSSVTRDADDDGPTSASIVPTGREDPDFATRLKFPSLRTSGILPPTRMAYTQDLPSAARRHRDAALSLDVDPPAGKRDVAGYLFGVAAECALKEIMRVSGMRPLPRECRRDDPFFMHFPELKTTLRDRAHGRHQARLVHHARDGALMSEWDTDMRYAPGRDVLAKPLAKWREQAVALVTEMEGT